jgi:hypothetical protein
MSPLRVFGVGKQPGHDLLPLPFKRVFVGTPPAQHPFSPLLLAVQVVEPGFRIGDTPFGKNVSCYTPFYRKDANGCRRDAWNERRAIHSTAKDGLLLLLQLVREAEGVERLCHLSLFVLLLSRQNP